VRELSNGVLGLGFRIGAQPQRDVRGLHRLRYHPYEIVIERLQIRRVPELDGESFEGLPGVVFAPVEAPVYERLDASPQRIEQRSDDEGRGDDDGLR